MFFLLQRMISPKIISHQTTKLHHKNRPFDVWVVNGIDWLNGVALKLGMIFAVLLLNE